MNWRGPDAGQLSTDAGGGRAAKHLAVPIVGTVAAGQ